MLSFPRSVGRFLAGGQARSQRIFACICTCTTSNSEPSPPRCHLRRATRAPGIMIPDRLSHYPPHPQQNSPQRAQCLPNPPYLPYLPPPRSAVRRPSGPACPRAPRVSRDGGHRPWHHLFATHAAMRRAAALTAPHVIRHKFVGTVHCARVQPQASALDHNAPKLGTLAQQAYQSEAFQHTLGARNT